MQKRKNNNQYYMDSGVIDQRGYRSVDQNPVFGQINQVSKIFDLDL